MYVNILHLAVCGSQEQYNIATDYKKTSIRQYVRSCTLVLDKGCAVPQYVFGGNFESTEAGHQRVAPPPSVMLRCFFFRTGTSRGGIGCANYVFVLAPAPTLTAAGSDPSHQEAGGMEDEGAKTTVSRANYAAVFGPTTGDIVRLADTDLYVRRDSTRMAVSRPCFGLALSPTEGINPRHVYQ